MLPHDYAQILVDELVRLNEKKATDALFKELTRRKAIIDGIYNEDLTDESYSTALSEQHLIDSFKFYHHVIDAKIKLLEKTTSDLLQSYTQTHFQSQPLRDELIKTHNDMRFAQITIQRLLIADLKEVKERTNG